MSDPGVMATLRAELQAELTEHLLPYWMEHTLDDVHGGFVGRITQEGHVVEDAPRGAVLNARILWTFAAALRVLGTPVYRGVAARALACVDTCFWDAEHEGVYWSLDSRGRPLDRRKQIYAQAFALYALTEYHRATCDAAALERAIRLFHLIEQHGHDPVDGGYFEAFDRDWGPLEDVRLSEKDLNAPKSMNTHLHVLEAYTNLARVWPDPLLRRRLNELVEIFLDRILDGATHHLRLFFDADWTLRSETVSYGHDIEASWLLLEAADVLADAALRARVRTAAVEVARVTLQEGQDADGGLFNELHPGGRLDDDKHWWPQAEAIVGFVNAYEETGERAFLTAATAAWDFTKRCVIDGEHGEWFGRVRRDGVPYDGEDKVGLWKCPYHNARACLEVITRTGQTPVSRTGTDV